MYRGIKLAPSVICLDWLELKKDIENICRLGIDRLHYDICDGLFVLDYGLPFSICQLVAEQTSLPPAYHLMVEEPRHIFEQIPKLPGSLIYLHYEACRNLHRELVYLRKMGFSPGLVLCPATPLDYIEYVVEEVDSVMIMTVNPGAAGQKMVPQTLSKIEKLSQFREKNGLKLDITVDGNVSFQNIPAMIKAGADTLVLGTSGLLIPGMERQKAFLLLCQAIDEGLKAKEEVVRT